MFDDPKKELNRLDQELRAESYEEQLEMLQSQEIPSLDDLLDEEEDWFSDSGITEDGDRCRNPVDHPGTNVRDYRRAVYADETTRENAAVFVEKKKRRPAEKPEKAKPEGKRKDSVGCLPFVIFLELIGIAGMLWWWYRWLR